MKIEEEKDQAAAKISAQSLAEEAEIQKHIDDLPYQEREYSDLSKRYTTDYKYLQELLEKEK